MQVALELFLLLGQDLINCGPLALTSHPLYRAATLRG